MGNYSLKNAPSSILYFSVLPNDLLNSFYRLYLPVQLSLLWSELECFHWMVLQFDHSTNEQKKHSIVTYCATKGYLKVLKWSVITKKCKMDQHTCAIAAEYGHLDVLKWMTYHGVTMNKYTCHNAASNGHLQVLIWARANGCKWDDDTCLSAARAGHLSILQWLRENRCPWNSSTCEWAARNGHLHVLK